MSSSRGHRAGPSVLRREQLGLLGLELLRGHDALVGQAASFSSWPATPPAPASSAWNHWSNAFCWAVASAIWRSCTPPPRAIR